MMIKSKAVLVLVTLALAGCATTPQSRTQQKLDSIIIHEMAFAWARAGDVARFFNSVLEENNSQKDFSYIIDIDNRSDAPSASFRFRKVSLRQMLDAMCEEGILNYTIDREGTIHINKVQPTAAASPSVGTQEVDGQ